MDLNDTPEQAAYREALRAWLEQHKAEAPPRSGSYEDTSYIDARRAWQRKLAEAGFAGVTWPKELGGQGLGPIEQVTVNQEVSQAQVPGVLDVIGIGMLGRASSPTAAMSRRAAISVRCCMATRCGASSCPRPSGDRLLPDGRDARAVPPTGPRRAPALRREPVGR